MSRTTDHDLWMIVRGRMPLAATAIHDGHRIRPEVAELLAPNEETLLREEDPFTAQLTRVSDTRVVVHRSRFEVDLNRPPEKAIYLKPEDAWGLRIWQQEPTVEMVERSREEYRRFYREMTELFNEMRDRFGRFVVYDIHSYNYRRDGAAADPTANPEVNLGTGTMNRSRWAPVVDRFLSAMRDADFLGRRLDVRENVKFRGGYFARWTHRHYPESACVLSIEFKKIFMDEWKGTPDPRRLDALQEALASTVPAVLEELHGL